MADERNINTPYVRQPRPHTSQGAVDDLAANTAASAAPTEPTYTHDSSYTLNSRTPIQSRSYRKARSEQIKFSQGNKYGQYLSVPKGSREIFASREQQAHKRKLVIGIVVVAILVIALIVLWPK